MTGLFELRITATGEVRDADGNLLNQVPIESVQVVTAEEAERILSGIQPVDQEGAVQQ